MGAPRDELEPVPDDREPCTCTLACQPAVELGEERYCREAASCAEPPAPAPAGARW